MVDRTYTIHRIRFSDLKRIVIAMRENGMSDTGVIQQVICCLNEINGVDD